MKFFKKNVVHLSWPKFCSICENLNKICPVALVWILTWTTRTTTYIGNRHFYIPFWDQGMKRRRERPYKFLTYQFVKTKSSFLLQFSSSVVYWEVKYVKT